MKKVVIVFCVLMLSAGAAMAQTVYDPDQLKQKYPDERSVYISKKTHVILDIVADTLVVKVENAFERIYLDTNKLGGTTSVEKNIYYSALNPIEKVEAKTVVNDGKKEKTYKVKFFFDKDVTQPGIFYNDLKAKVVLFPEVQKGARTYLAYTETYLEPHLLSPNVFSEDIPVLTSEFSVTYKNNINIGLQFISVEEKALSSTTTTKGDYTTKVWIMKDVPAEEYESDAPNFRYTAPQVLLLIKDAVINGKKVSFAGDVNEVYNWCYGFYKEVSNSETPEMKSLVDSLTNGATTDMEKSQRIWYWVQDNIRYVAFENGYGGFIPRNAQEVFSKRYGDCKDMANLLSHMHRMSGLDAHVMWIGSRDLPYAVSKVPTACSFNHMIAVARIDNKDYILDATGRFQHYGFQTAFIQGKEGLVGISADSFRVLTVPVIKREVNNFVDTTNIQLNGRVLTGTGSKYLTGYPKINMSYRFTSKNELQKDESIKDYLVTGSNKCKINEYQLSNLLDRDKPLYFNYKFTLDDYAVIVGDEAFINMNLNKDFSKDKIDESKRHVPIESEFKYEIKEVTSFTIPEGYKSNNIPKNKSFDSEKFGFKIEYSLQGDKIIYKKSVYIDYLMLETSDFKLWNTMIAELNSAYKDNISIIKK